LKRIKHLLSSCKNLKALKIPNELDFKPKLFRKISSLEKLDLQFYYEKPLSKTLRQQLFRDLSYLPKLQILHVNLGCPYTSEDKELLQALSAYILERNLQQFKITMKASQNFQGLLNENPNFQTLLATVDCLIFSDPFYVVAEPQTLSFQRRFHFFCPHNITSQTISLIIFSCPSLKKLFLFSLLCFNPSPCDLKLNPGLTAINLRLPFGQAENNNFFESLQQSLTSSHQDLQSLNLKLIGPPSPDEKGLKKFLEVPSLQNLKKFCLAVLRQFPSFLQRQFIGDQEEMSPAFLINKLQVFKALEHLRLMIFFESITSAGCIQQIMSSLPSSIQDLNLSFHFLNANYEGYKLDIELPFDRLPLLEQLYLLFPETLTDFAQDKFLTGLRAHPNLRIFAHSLEFFGDWPNRTFENLTKNLPNIRFAFFKRNPQTWLLHFNQNDPKSKRILASKRKTLQTLPYRPWSRNSPPQVYFY